MKSTRKMQIQSERRETGTLRRRVGSGFLVTLLVMSVLYTGFVAYTMRVYHEKQESFNKNVAESYARQMEKDISMLESFIKSIVNSNRYFERLCYPSQNAFDWVTQVNGMTSTFKNKTVSIEYPAALYFFDPTRENGLIMTYSDEYSSQALLRQSIYDALRKRLPDSENGSRYELLDVGDSCLLYVYTLHGRSLGFLLDLTMYEESYVMFDIDGQQLAVLDGGGSILALTPSDTVTEAVRALAFRRENTRRNGYGTLVLREKVGSYPLQLALIEDTGDLLSISDHPLFLVFLLGTPAVIAALFLGLYGYLRRIMLMPLDYLRRRVGRVRTNEECAQTPEPAEQSAEFAQMNVDLDEIINEIMRLQEEKYQKERDADLAQLQYFQLQLNPHFFLNCLNIIYSLHKNGDEETEKKFMAAMIAHFRYVFNDKLSLVKLRDELKEIRDYVDLYTIRKGAPVLLRIQADEDCLDERIPILAIQTFVENSIKYAADGHSILSVSIHAFRVKDGAQEYVCVQLHDNGRGYTDDWLAKNNTFGPEVFRYSGEHVGIPNLKYRMHLIYKGAAHLAFHNHPDGGAAVDIFFPVNGEVYDEYSDR